MEKTLNKIFNFLIENRIYNKELQIRDYSTIIKPQTNTSEKVISLLYNIANTQSQPNINHLSNFYKKIHLNYDSIGSFEGFMSIVNPNKKPNYHNLYIGMKDQSGWGEKTSALFTKTIFHLHNNEYPSELIIWKDAPSNLEKDDIFQLPVDSVIIAIFKYLKNKKWDFVTVNQEIKNNYHGIDIEVWDDLWFWGFISQIGTGDNREMNWNLNKYWTLRQSDKNQSIIDEIENKTTTFLQILNEERDKCISDY